jgi:hypothetical protein
MFWRDRLKFGVELDKARPEIGTEPSSHCLVFIYILYVVHVSYTCVSPMGGGQIRLPDCQEP